MHRRGCPGGALARLAILALAVKMKSDGPTLHRAVRVRPGGTFTLLKLRTMRVGSTDVGPAVTAAGDPRVTALGRWLRATKLDELPQLWNVVRGEMLLVGPRPEDPRFVDLLDPVHRLVFSALPGITGPTALAYRDEEQLLADAARDVAAAAGRGVATTEDVDTAYRTRILPRSSRWMPSTSGRGPSPEISWSWAGPSGRCSGAPRESRVGAMPDLTRVRGRHLFVADLAIVALAIVGAMVLRFNSFRLDRSVFLYLPAALIPLLIRPAVNVGAGLYARAWAYASIAELARIVGAALIGSGIIVAVFYLVLVPLGVRGTVTEVGRFPRSFFALEGLLSLVGFGPPGISSAHRRNGAAGVPR